MIEAFTNPEIDFTDQEWKDLVMGTSGLNPDMDESVVQCLGQAPRLMGRVRKAKRQPAEYAQRLPGFVAEAAQLHENIQWALHAQQQRLLTFDGPQPGFFHAHYTRMYSLGLSVAISISHTYACLTGDEDGQLQEEIAHYTREVIRLAEVSQPYRPLGGLVMVVSSSVAWICVADSQLRQQACDVYKDFFNDIMIRDPTETDRILETTARTFKLDDNPWGGFCCPRAEEV